jgi:hypothetical protein
MFLMFFMCLNYHLTFYLLGNCVNWVIDLFLTLLVCVCVCVQDPNVPNVFHVPKLSFNLLSIGKLCELGYRLVFYSSGVCVCVCRILERAKHLGPGLELGDCLSFHPYTFPSLGSLMLSFHHHHLWLFGIHV